MRLTVGATRADSSSPSIPREKQHSQLLRPICALLLLLATAGTIVQATGAHERQAARVLSPTRGHATSRGGGGGGATSSGAAVAIAVTRQQPQQRQQHAATSGNVAVANNRERVRKIDLICQKIRRKAEWAELFRRTSGKQRPNVPPQLDVFIVWSECAVYSLIMPLLSSRVTRRWLQWTSSTDGKF